MTGEMHESEVTRESYPVHFAIADILNGTVRPFDQYQGPYILTSKGRLWLVSQDCVLATIYNEDNQCESKPFFVEDTKAAQDAALSVTTITKEIDNK